MNNPALKSLLTGHEKRRSLDNLATFLLCLRPIGSRRRASTLGIPVTHPLMHAIVFAVICKLGTGSRVIHDFLQRHEVKHDTTIHSPLVSSVFWKPVSRQQVAPPLSEKSFTTVEMLLSACCTGNIGDVLQILKRRRSSSRYNQIMYGSSNNSLYVNRRPARECLNLLHFRFLADKLSVLELLLDEDPRQAMTVFDDLEYPAHSLLGLALYADVECLNVWVFLYQRGARLHPEDYCDLREEQNFYQARLRKLEYLILPENLLRAQRITFLHCGSAAFSTRKKRLAFDCKSSSESEK